MGARGAAFFDVDETLITLNSCIDFLDHRMHRSRDPRVSAWRLLAPVVGLDRVEANRAYFRLYAGLSVASVAAQGRAWFAEVRDRLFHQPVLAELRAHSARGARIVLVSGAFPACLDPIAAAVGAADVLCSLPVVADGRYTGETERTMIGAAKATAARAYLAAHAIAAADCHAYGDHASDLPMLDTVGTPVVVGADPVLSPLAVRRGWRALPGPAPYRETVAHHLSAGAPLP
ncbi:HAD-IB family hydrolase [Actinokineospora iranica]|uniref:HAD-superfamily subfamily IB hydrolase, TIGR01490 n=1 Tax=Actinokineospora iranica TaxID=1271860 RepID=A0A1G6SR92_9PSEU|nr:HAD-IB family hydrolase [Actinokineospora iranica]SDD18717.1 HAD-superfamily subfamily IB hydrolase, TIGR01490 [Actinokineospora iranica]